MTTSQPESQPESTPQARQKGFVFQDVSLRGRKPKLRQLMEFNEAGYRQILMIIEQGVYDYVVAEALGVSVTTWSRWIKEGQAATDGYKREFYDDVMKAKARARLSAELEVRRDDAKFWLRCGPGKTKTGRPGWTENIGIVGDEEADAIQHEHSGQIGIAFKEESSNDELAESLRVMAELGMISINENMAKGLQAPSPALSPEMESQASGNGHDPQGPIIDGQVVAPTQAIQRDESIEDYDDEEEEDNEDRGYNPEGNTPLSDIEMEYYRNTPSELDPRRSNNSNGNGKH